mmetsp:Transcript_7671/g.17560  ORF Transcript_7671/g.17560 Transcript_7671/m.17560 type:complete len:236 (-) Transcript_7671:16-723(-)
MAAGGRVLGGRGAAGAAVLAVVARLGIGKVALGGALLRVNAAVLHVDLGATSVLDGDGGGHLEEVGVRNEGVLLLDGLEQLEREREASVGAVVDLGIEADGADGAPAVGPLLDVNVIGAAVVPGQANHDGVGVGLVDKVPEVLLARLELLDVVVGSGHEDDGAARGKGASGGRVHKAGASQGRGRGRAHVEAGHGRSGRHKGVSDLQGAGGGRRGDENALGKHHCRSRWGLLSFL